ncbi:MAG: RNA 2',3'-cyclic phosphodiesterase [Candidatus Micrarchaeota archaeon]|nr:RNA 2',3'-cyclic phosphodiesterase [Candidatus Micrarchaeota archaeon]
MRLFVAIRPPPSAIPELQRVCLPLKDALGVKLVPPENLHITLKFIGEVGEKDAQKVADALQGVSFDSFELSLSTVGAFPNAFFPKAIWVGGISREAEELAKKVSSALSFLGLPKEDFKLHLTVARAPKSAADIQDFLSQPPFSISFRVESFFLIKSRLTPPGPIYENIKEYFACKKQ